MTAVNGDSARISKAGYAAVTQMVAVSLVIGEPKQFARHQRNPEKLEQLAASMAAEGLHQPIGILETMKLIFGHGRLLAAIRLGWTEILARIYPASLSPVQAGIAGWSENAHRLNLTPIEKFEKCQELLSSDATLKKQDLATLMNVTPGGLTRILAIGRVEPVFQEALAGGLLTQEEVYEAAGMSAKDRFAFLALKRETASESTRGPRTSTRSVRRPNVTPTAKQSRLCIPVVGANVNIAGVGLGMPEIARALEAALQEVRMVAEHCDAKQFAKMMRTKKGQP